MAPARHLQRCALHFRRAAKRRPYGSDAMNGVSADWKREPVKRGIAIPVPCSLIPIPYSLIPIPYSLIPIPYSLIPNP